MAQLANRPLTIACRKLREKIQIGKGDKHHLSTKFIQFSGELLILTSCLKPLFVKGLETYFVRSGEKQFN